MVNSESLNKRLSYLALADFSYIASRLLLINGLTHIGLAKALETFELLLKLFLLLANKIEKDIALEQKHLKHEYKHKLIKLLDELRSKIPVKFDESWDRYFLMLENAYDSRYPEGWKKGIFENDIHTLDTCYRYLRNNIIKNFPMEELERAKDFGGFISKGYSADINDKIMKQGGNTVKGIFEINNLEAKNFDMHPLR